MDSNDLERERGITILSKCTSVTWKGVRINLVDTPGHADFGGEVERVLGMVDAVLLVVDAYEGPMPQTRFVTQKAFEMGLSPLVVINKIDRPGVEPEKVMDPVFDLFVSLGASDHQLDFPIIYASGREGFAIRELTDERKDLSPLLDMIIEKVPPARCACRWRPSTTTTSSATWRSAACAPARPRSATASSWPTATARRRSSGSRRSSASRASSASSWPSPRPATCARSPA
jgi:GTP-binding protein